MEFTNVVKEVTLMTQAKGIWLHQYLDDWLILSQTKESCCYQTQALLTLWSSPTHSAEMADLERQTTLSHRKKILLSKVVHVPPRSDGNRKTGAVRKITHETHSVAPQMESLKKNIPIPAALHPHLKWWLQEDNVLLGQPLHPLQHALQLFTDASREGGGAHKTFMVSARKQTTHKHVRAQGQCRRQVVLIATDNTTVVSYINKEGGVRSGSLCALLWRLL